jgi:multidrug efflux pump subunit AcrA (membrane-fusion protein)
MNRAFIAFLLLVLVSCGDKKVSILPTIGDVTESVYASGKVKAVDQYTVYPTVNGILKTLHVKAGDAVVKDQVLFELDNKVTALNSENARLALDLSADNNRKGSDKFQEIELSVNQAYDKYLLDSNLFVRQKNLWDQQVGTQVEFDQKKIAFTNSKSAYLSAKSKYAQVKTQLENELQKAKVNYNITEKNQHDYQIKSELAGRVFDVLKVQGELVTPQTPLAIIGSNSSFLLELEVDENDIVRIREGQSVVVTMDSYKGQALEAVVTKIYPIMNERTRTFKIEAQFTHPPKELFPNLTVEANIILQSRKNVITIPKEYLVEGKYVFVNKNEKREVKTGLKDYKSVEIISGLAKDEKIYLLKQ